ncbi:kinase domain protein [Ostertagia ostertagi]
MSFFGKMKNLFRSPAIEEARRPLPSIIEVNVNPKDSWEIVGELGDGAFGKVEKAVSRTDRSLFAAAKAIEVQEGEELEDFLVEIDILTSCKHVNIVNLYACYFFENKLHMMLEFCGGGAVDAIMIELEKPLTEKQIAYVARYTCEAIAFLHDNNIIHRDLKAGNILLTSDAVVKLADFGVSAKLKDRNERRDTFIGTPYWMAPEVMMCETFKDQPYGTISDIWSFGITLIEMAQMEPPHSNVSPMRVLIKVQKSAPPTLENPSSWSIFFADFLSQCLVKNPAERKTAKQILSHPFIANATDRHPVLALLAEVNADIEEEVVIDEDRASCDESCADSEDQSSVEAMWTNPTPVPPPVKDVAVATTEAPAKKRAAPPPPPIAQPTATPQTSDMNKELFVQATTPSQPSKTPSEIVSPGREALNILDDLTTALDKQNSSSMHSISDGPIPSEAPQVAPNLVTVHSPVPEHKIRDVVGAVRSPTKSPTPVAPKAVHRSGSVVSSSENVYRQDSLHKAESHQSVQDKGVQDKTVVKLGINIPHEVLTNTEKLRGYFEQNSQQTAHAGDKSSISNIVSTSEGKLSSVAPTSPTVLPTSASEQAISHRTHSRVQSEEPQVFTRSGSLKGQVVPSKPSSPSSQSLPGVHKSKTEPPQHFSAPSSDRESPPNSKDYNYFEQFPAGPSAETTYFSSSSSSDKKGVPPPEPPVDYNDQQNSKGLMCLLLISRHGCSFGANLKPVKKMRRQPHCLMEPHSLRLLGMFRGIKMVLSIVPRRKLGETTFAVRKHPHRQTVTKKTRTYTIDGMQVTSTTMHVLGTKEDMQMRKQQLQDLRRLQREEARQKQELQLEGANLVEQQERKFQQEKAVLTRQYEIDMEALERKQKREIEEAEKVQEDELKQAQKRLKYEQEKDLRAFKERLKQEMKIMKQEMDMLPRHQRKDAFRMKKDQMEHENHLKEADFVMQLQKNAEATLARLTQKHKEKMAALERQFLMQKHLLLRAKENSDWELEEKQMGEKYVLHRKLFKDEYFLLRTQMLARHQKELAQAQKFNQEEEEELVRALALDRKKLPKMLRNEAKTRSHMFKESLRISMQSMTPAEMSEKLRRFDEQENMRIRNALEEHDMKSARKIAQLKEKHQFSMNELDEMQNEKRKQLLEKERNTMQEHEKKYYSMREQWQADLAPRKLMLESRFQEEMEAQERFYGISLSGTIASTPIMPGRMH